MSASPICLTSLVCSSPGFWASELGGSSIVSSIIAPQFATGQTTWHVDLGAPHGGNGSSLAPLSSIQDAIAASGNGDVVLVAPGIYPERIDFLGKSIQVRSTSGAVLTIIRPTTPGSVVRSVSGESSQTLLEGFTITGGVGMNSEPGRVGGVRILSASPTLRNCLITGNSGANATIPSAPGGPGGLLVDTGSPYFVECGFEGNLGGNGANGQSPCATSCLPGGPGGPGGAAVVAIGSTQTTHFLRCSFRNNVGGESGLDPTNTVRSNVGGADAAHLEGATIVRNSLVQGNQAGPRVDGIFGNSINFGWSLGGTGGLWCSGTQISNAVIAYNTGSLPLPTSPIGGAGGVTFTGPGSITNCTIVGNIPAVDCGGVILEGVCFDWTGATLGNSSRPIRFTVH